MSINVTKFGSIFETLNLDDMRKKIKELNNGRAGREFELFSKYVFERAGFYVNDVAQERKVRGIDFELYPLSRDFPVPIAYVQAKHVAQPVGLNDIMNLGGVILPHPNTIKIMITSNKLSTDALEQSSQYTNVLAIDIDYLIRYIRFIRGSRYLDDRETVLHPSLIAKADSVRRRLPKSTIVLTLANDKGGVGKTTSVINISTLLAEIGQNVLVVDLDAQANLTKRMGLSGISPEGKSRSMTDYFFGKHSLAHLIRPTDFKNLWIIPSAHNVNLTAKGVNDWAELAIKFTSDLHDLSISPPPYIAHKFDWIIIDTPTTDEFRIRLALAASHFILAPAIPSSFAASGLQVLFSSIDAMQGLMGEHVQLIGCFLTQCGDINSRTRELLGDTLDALRNRNVQLLKTTIPRSQSVETAHFRQRSLFGRSVLSVVAHAYKELVEKELVPYVNSYSD